MKNSLQQPRGVCALITRDDRRTATGSTMLIAILMLVAITVLGQQSASAQNKLKLRDGFANEAYTFNFADAVKGEGSGAQWSVVTGTLPSGLTLSTAGVLDGTPTTAGGNTFEVQAKVGATETFRTTVILRVLPPGFDVAQLDASGASSASVGAAAAAPVCPPTPSTFVLASSTADEETIALTEDASAATMATLNQNTLQILDAAQLIQTTLGNTPIGAAPPVFKEGDYTIIHIIKWKAVKADAEKTDPEKELWALYELVDGGAGQGLKWEARMSPEDKENFDTRIFGSRRVAVLLLHLQTPRTWDVKYKIDINRRVPQPIQNALQLAAFVGGAGATDTDCEPSLTRNIWGGRLMLVRHMASDVIVKLNTVTANGNGGQISQSKEHSKTYLNEGRYHWDVSVGMPVISIKALEFSSENGVVTAKKTEKQNAYGFLNLFPRAVDLNGKSFLTSPHFVLGVPISGKPLDRPLIGVGTGLYTKQFKINFFAGVAFNRVREPRTLTAGETATAGQLENDLETRRVRKFVFGINFPVKQFIDAVKGAK